MQSLSKADRIIGIGFTLLAVPLLFLDKVTFDDWLAAQLLGVVAIFGWAVILLGTGVAADWADGSRLFHAASIAGFVPRDGKGRLILGAVLVGPVDFLLGAILVSALTWHRGEQAAVAVVFIAAQAAAVGLLIWDARADGEIHEGGSPDGEDGSLD